MPYGSFTPRFSGFGSFYQPSATGLRFEDLYRPTPRPSYPGPPEWIDEPGELGDPDRRLLRRNAMLLAAQALAGPSGEIGLGLTEAAQRSTGFREHLIERARGEQEERYRAERAQAEREVEEQRFEIAEEERADRVRQMLRLRDEIASADPALARRAETALALGDVAGLRRLQEEIPTRRAMRAMGQDPDNPFADEEARARIQTKAEAERAEAKLGLLPRELGMRSQADIDEEVRKRSQGLGGYFQHPPQPVNFQRFEHGGQQYTFDPRARTATPLAGVQPAAAGADPAWQKAVEQAQRERAAAIAAYKPEIVNVEERARRIYEIMKTPPPAPKGARGPVPQRTVTESVGAPMGPGGSVGKTKPPPVKKVAGLAAPAPRDEDKSLMNDIKADLDDPSVGEPGVRRILRGQRYSDAEIARLITRARSGG